MQAQVRQKVTDRDQKVLKKAINNLKASAGPKGKKSEDTTDVGYQQEIGSVDSRQREASRQEHILSVARILATSIAVVVGPARWYSR